MSYLNHRKPVEPAIIHENMDDDCTVDLNVDDISEMDEEVLEFEGFVNEITTLSGVSGGAGIGAGGSE